MGVLSSLLAKKQAIREGVDWLEQELLGAMLASVEKIQACHPVL
jgi:U3 small nucleolar RNA-associated protein 10